VPEGRAEWLSLKQALEAYKRRHRRQAPPGCQCPLCLSPQQLQARTAAILERQRLAAGEPPF